MAPVSERKSETHELLPTAAAEAVTLPDWGPPFACLLTIINAPIVGSALTLLASCTTVARFPLPHAPSLAD